MEGRSMENRNQATFDLEGATCASCAFAIEHIGKKIEGIDSIHVDAAKREITVDYHGNGEVLQRIADIVRKLGYRAELKA